MVITPYQLAGALVLALMAMPGRAEFSFAAGPYIQQLKYTEFSQSGHVLDADKGTLFGPHLSLNWITERITFNLDYHYLSGDLDYNSQQADSTVDASAEQFSTGIEVFLPVAENFKLSILGELGSHSRQRDIASSGIYFGLNETYDYYFASFGVGIGYQRNNTDAFRLSSSLIQAYHSTIDVQFLSEQFDSVTFAIDEATGYNVNLQWLRQYSTNWRLNIEYQYTYVETDRSASAPLFRGGFITSRTVSEPASEMTSSSLLIGISRLF